MGEAALQNKEQKPGPVLKVHFDLFTGGREYFSSFEAAIHEAQNEILLEVYIFATDRLGLRILDALAKASNRGVNVRLLVDGIGSINWISAIDSFCTQHSIAFNVYHPVPFSSYFSSRWSWMNFSKSQALFGRINKRNHRKLLLIDRKVAFVGSLNVIEVHSEEFYATKAWRDTGLRLQGVPMKSLVQAFERAWRNLSPFRPNRSWILSDFFRLNFTRQIRLFNQRDLLRQLKLAKQRILITNAYFLPRRPILRQLIRASERGVFVGLILPGPSDIPLVKWAARSMYVECLRAGIHIYEYQPSVLHAKTLIIDDFASLGSHNWNHRSFMHDLELEVSLPSQEFTQQLVSHWDADISQCRSLTLKDCGRTNLFFRALYKMSYWIRYWL